MRSLCNRAVRGLLARAVAEDLTPAESTGHVGRALLAHQEAHLTDDATLLLLGWPGPAST